MDLNDKTINTIYPIVQVGYGINNMDYPIPADMDNGLYWGIGLGATIKENFLVELLYSSNNGEIKPLGAPFTVDATYKTFKLKAGYKFGF